MSTNNTADYLLLSFPKCGRTWLRLMIGKILQTHFELPDNNILNLDELAELHPKIPKITVMHDDRAQWQKPDDLTTSKAQYKDKQVIFLVRDPRDVVVSSYFQKTKRKRWQAYEGSLSEYILEESGSFDSIIKFYNIWAENIQVPQRFLLIRYEDIHADANKELRRVIDFLGLEEIGDDILDFAIEYASFENMRKMEEQNTFNVNRMRPGNPADPESYKTRKGKVGGFSDYLNETEISYLTKRMTETLSPFYRYNTNS